MLKVGCWSDLMEMRPQLLGMALMVAMGVMPTVASEPSAQGISDRTYCDHHRGGVRSLRAVDDVVLTSDLFIEAHAQILRHYFRDVDGDRLKAAAIQEVCKRYQRFDDIEEGQLANAAIHGMMASLNLRSSYLGRDQVRAFRELEQQRLGGVGIQFKKGEKYFDIISLDYAMPAEKAGLKAGDRLVAIDGRLLDGRSRQDVWFMLHGKPGSTVALTLERGESGPFEVALERVLINRQAVGVLNMDRIGYLRIIRFSDRTASDLQSMIHPLRMMVGRNPRGFVVDLRGNPGGSFAQSVKVSSIFLSSGRVVTVRKHVTEDHYDVAGGDQLNGLPIVVLINKATMGASEIVAGALKDHRRAVLVGEKTFGGGTEETLIPLSNGNALRLTTAAYLTPSGTEIDNGIAPDYVVLNVDDDQGEDEQLAFARKLLNDGRVSPATRPR